MTVKSGEPFSKPIANSIAVSRCSLFSQFINCKTLLATIYWSQRKAFIMATRDELTAEEHSILSYVETILEKRRMGPALAMLRDERTKLEDLRAIIEGFRELYRRQRQ